METAPTAQTLVERLLREAAAAEVRLWTATGAVLGWAVSDDPACGVPMLPPPIPTGFDQLLWEGPQGALLVRRLADGGHVAVAFDQRSTQGTVRVRVRELERLRLATDQSAASASSS